MVFSFKLELVLQSESSVGKFFNLSSSFVIIVNQFPKRVVFNNTSVGFCCVA
jgi:hypothetical protein